jgi:hypothetical protein
VSQGAERSHPSRLISMSYAFLVSCHGRGRWSEFADECFGLKATVEPRVTWPERRLFGQVTRSAFEKPPPPPLAGVSGMDLRLLYVQYRAHDDYPNFNFLFRLS